MTVYAGGRVMEPLQMTAKKEWFFFAFSYPIHSLPDVYLKIKEVYRLCFKLI
jgi:hypothetical protein